MEIKERRLNSQMAFLRASSYVDQEIKEMENSFRSALEAKPVKFTPSTMREQSGNLELTVWVTPLSANKPIDIEELIKGSIIIAKHFDI